ncbi:MAG: thiamine pyrophosphate-dependent dehydrogenase E1 component subunit alpha [Deltaproteobacteria bacterium]|jgi:acetoin:2,6-dichlorophenolindophenol oxidoreductase subunit alpha|nr:thiamine pyrophosphate-dependent dehydrogenase E1 component subunit alpha [Deltaproteobacteria bacterium]MBT4638461.1 thiamine pyrophosphate-dependent dehydrogenase E1 component subunit alpha [Deltaproteobacteria bacterium]MBT6503921.1 thiamine pyrophosphate-dependent dehydrogenase E1 component subunit alpha [Deltaproteobacteria bacterium]MBT6611897.1 thiamine pyrophosphate-dependent dehydrogenase E1 component subunit alpha [Deltaproteobacteria bacterium]MBT7154357.1 thiamine pyrophosphate-d
MPKLSKKEGVHFFQEMVKIRTVEEKLMEVFFKGEIPGFIHVCIGQEATPVAVCAHLQDSDYISTTHRGHGHVLAKGIDLNSFMAELFGRKNGPCRGRSGSMHLADSDLGILGANGIVGGGIPIATGAAFASRYKKTEQVTVCFFGDGATSEGTFHESLNIASLRKLPIVFVCENNGWAEFTPQETHMPIKNIVDRAAGYDMPGVMVTNDFFKIYEAAAKAVKNARKGRGPTLIEVKSRRWHGHYVGDAQKYRIEDDITAAKKDDCILNFEKVLLKEKKLLKKEVKTIREKTTQRVADAIEFARESPFPEASELMDDLYV